MNRPLLAALLLGLSLASAPVSAQTSDADRATARALAIEGQDALEKSNSPPPPTASPAPTRSSTRPPSCSAWRTPRSASASW